VLEMKMVVAAVALATAVWAQGPTLVVTTGDCADPELTKGGSEFQDAAKRLPGVTWVDWEAALDDVRPRASPGLEELERRVRAAQALFYEGHTERAHALVETVVAELEHSPPEERVWPLTMQTLMLKALIAGAHGHAREMEESLHRIARVDPDTRLDATQYPPSAVAALDARRNGLARRRQGVVVRTETGQVASVFVEGRAMGVTPLQLKLAEGTYRVILLNDGQRSFPHRLVVAARGAQLTIDFAFESSIHLGTPLCLNGATGAALVKLGRMVNAEQLLVLKISERNTTPRQFIAEYYSIDNPLPERTASGDAGHFAALAESLITGAANANVEPVGPPTAAVPLAPRTQRDDESVTAPLAAPIPFAASRANRWWWIPVGAGLLAGAVGAASMWFADEHFSRLSTTSSRRLPQSETDLLVREGNIFQPLGWTCIVLGAASITAGGVLAFVHPPPPANAPRLSVGISGTGAALTLDGSW
jgi:hypothetical protein